MKADVLRGHLDSLILAVVDEEPLHGYAIIEALRVRSGGQLDIPTGSVYPGLRRLEAAGYLTSGWSTTGGRRRRTYALSASGHRALAAQRQEWIAFSSVVSAVLRPA
ncbi:MAG: helix-turn-helix transcriptional regulator [Lacisediminihabitans sp.]